MSVLKLSKEWQDIRWANPVTSSTVPVSICSWIDSKDDCFRPGFLGSLEDSLRGSIISIEVNLLESDLSVVCWLRGGNLLDGKCRIQSRLAKWSARIVVHVVADRTM